MTQPFAELVENARSGDAACLRALIERHLPELRAFIRLRSGPQLRAKESQSDLVQTVCARILEDLPGYRGDDERSFKAWLLTTAYHKITDKGRFWARDKRDSRRETTSAELLDCYASFCTPSRQAMAREEITRIEKAIDSLPEVYREVITLRCVAGLPYPEVASRIDRSVDATRHLLIRAKAKLAMLAAQDGASR